MTTSSQHTPLYEKNLGDFPLLSAGNSAKLFPPVEYKSHWDPTQIIKRTLPNTGQSLPLPLDFRPWTRVCKVYRTSGPSAVAPLPPNDVVFGMGGEFYPPGRYSAAIDQESQLRYLDRKLDKWCQSREYTPSFEGDMFQQRVLIPEKKDMDSESCVADRVKWDGCLPRVSTDCKDNLNNGETDRTQVIPGGMSQLKPPESMVQELNMPRSVLREGPYNCREEVDIKNWERSPRLFNNTTKNDKFWDVKRDGAVNRRMPGSDTKYSKSGSIRPALGHAGANILYETPYTERQAPA